MAAGHAVTRSVTRRSVSRNKVRMEQIASVRTDVKAKPSAIECFAPSETQMTSEPVVILFQPAWLFKPLAEVQRTLGRVVGKRFSRQTSLPPGWRAELYSPCSMYALSSFTYSILGMQMLYQNVWYPDAAPGWPARPYGILEAVWVILMGFVSYASDGLMVGKTSWAHVIDRILAPALYFLQVFKFGFLFLPWLTWPEKIWTWALGLIFGAVIKWWDSETIARNDLEGYRFMHQVWHLHLPLIFGAFNIYLVMRSTSTS